MEERTNYVQEKIILLILVVEIIVGLVGYGFYRGSMYAIENTQVSYHAGKITFTLDDSVRTMPVEFYTEDK